MRRTTTRHAVPVGFLCAMAAACDPAVPGPADPATPHFTKGAGAKPASPPPLRLTIPTALPDAAANIVLSDGRTSVSGAPTGSYDDGVCGVIVSRDGDTTAAMYFRPDGFYAPKRNSTCPPEPRAAYVRLSPAMPVHLTDDPHQDTSLEALGLVTADQVFDLGSLKVRALTHTIGVSDRPATVNFPFCLDDGVGKGMRYNPGDYPGSDYLVVTQLSGASWHAQTKPWPENKAWCEHTSADGSTVTLIMHLDVAVDVEEIP